MGTQVNVSKKQVRKMMGESHKSKPFRTRANGMRVEWVWEGDELVVKNVRKG